MYQLAVLKINCLILFIMRSLYTEDIEGTKPKPTIFQKGYYKKKLQDQIKRSPRNPDKTNQYQWFVPLPKSQRPTYSREPYRNTIKLISEHTGVSNSMHFESLKKYNNDSLPQRKRNYSLLSQSGYSLLNKSKIQVNEGSNPYYPHRIRQAYDKSNSTKFTGKRNWNYDPNPSINLADPRSEYTSKWIRI